MRTCLQTRSSTGARLALPLTGLLIAIALASPAAAQRFEVGELPWRVGGDLGFTVDAAAFPDSAEGHLLMVYLRVPPTTLQALVRDSSGVGRFRVEMRLKGAYGGRKGEYDQEFEDVAGSEEAGLGKVVQTRFVVRPGAHELEVKLEDLQSKKRGLIYMGRDVHEDAKVKGEFDVPEPQNGRSISSIEFVWSDQPGAQSSPFVRHGRMVLPNADRLYGRFESTLRAHFRARGKLDDRRPWIWVARLFDKQGHELSKVDSTGPASQMLEASLVMDLRGLPAGGYDLEIKAWQDGDEGALLRRSRFSIGWQPSTWLRKTYDIEDEVHFLLDAEEEEAFVQLHPGEQERYMIDYWEKRDPNPETSMNEAKAIYEERIRFANANYSRVGLVKGMFTDRGRVYIRYGEPSEVLQQVIPAGDATLEQMIYEIAYAEDRSPEHVLQPGPGGDMRPFEVWLYEGNIPLPIEADPTLRESVARNRLVFLFVDDQGLGSYTLRYTTE